MWIWADVRTLPNGRIDIALGSGVNNDFAHITCNSYTIGDEKVDGKWLLVASHQPNKFGYGYRSEMLVDAINVLD